MKIIAEIVIGLKLLEKAKSFHGRLKLNNVYIDKGYRIKMNDYGIYNEVYRGHKKGTNSDINSVEKTPSGSSGKNFFVNF